MTTSTVDFDEIKRILIDHFEIEEADVTPEAHLYEDLGLDSIDAVDLVIKLQEISGKRFRPDQFKDVRTVDDVIRAVEKLLG